jgi:hypothetical protein
MKRALSLWYRLIILYKPYLFLQNIEHSDLVLVQTITILVQHTRHSPITIYSSLTVCIIHCILIWLWIMSLADWYFFHLPYLRETKELWTRLIWSNIQNYKAVSIFMYRNFFVLRKMCRTKIKNINRYHPFINYTTCMDEVIGIARK